MKTEFIVRRVSPSDPNFLALVAQLDADLAERDGEEHAFYNQFNSPANLDFAVLVRLEGKPVAIGGIKAFEQDSYEVKRMFTLPEARGKGAASEVLFALENIAKQNGAKRTVLETGKRQPEAIAFYEARGYQRIDNYGQYVGVENSVCFEKPLRSRKTRNLILTAFALVVGFAAFWHFYTSTDHYYLTENSWCLQNFEWLENDTLYGGIDAFSPAEYWNRGGGFFFWGRVPPCDQCVEFHPDGSIHTRGDGREMVPVGQWEEHQGELFLTLDLPYGPSGNIDSLRFEVSRHHLLLKSPTFSFYALNQTSSLRWEQED